MRHAVLPTEPGLGDVAFISLVLTAFSTKRLEQIEILEPPNGTSVIVIAIAILLLMGDATHTFTSAPGV